MFKSLRKISASLTIVSMLFSLLGFQTFANEDIGNLEDSTVSQEYDGSETVTGDAPEEVINEADGNEILCFHMHDENCGGGDLEENCNHIHSDDCMRGQMLQTTKAAIGDVFQTWGPSTMGGVILQLN